MLHGQAVQPGEPMLLPWWHSVWYGPFTVYLPKILFSSFRIWDV